MVYFPSEAIALYRAIIGSAFIFLFQKIRGENLDRTAVKTNLRWLVLSGASLGYLESATAIIISLVVFHEPMSVMAWAGAVMIISYAIISEIMPPQELKK